MGVSERVWLASHKPFVGWPRAAVLTDGRRPRNEREKREIVDGCSWVDGRERRAREGERERRAREKRDRGRKREREERERESSFPASISPADWPRLQAEAICS